MEWMLDLLTRSRNRYRIFRWPGYPGYYPEYYRHRNTWGTGPYVHNVCKDFELKNQFQNQIYPYWLSFFPSVGMIVVLVIVDRTRLIKKNGFNSIESTISFLCKQGQIEWKKPGKQIKQP